MAIGKASDFTIYQDEFHSGLFEAVEINTALFNEASAGCIQLVPQSHIGDYQKSTFLKAISGLFARRDTTSVAAVTDTAMTQGQNVGVKLNRKMINVAQTLDALRKVGMSQSEMSLRFGQMAGEFMVRDEVLMAVKAAATAVAGNASTLNSATGATITYAGIVGALAKFGDMADKIRCLVFHSKAWFDLVSSMATQSTTLDGVGNLSVQTGSVPAFGRRVIVVDSADLIVSGTPDHYRTLGLVEGGVVALESEPFEMVSDIVTGLENLVVRYQGEYAMTVSVQGFAWDIANGGAGPADAAVATASNWDQVATSDKHTAGVCLLTQ